MYLYRLIAKKPADTELGDHDRPATTQQFMFETSVGLTEMYYY